jgi:catechol 2,3-dioxygenase
VGLDVVAIALRSGERPRCRNYAAMSFGDLAHIGHVELLTPEPERSLRFFVEAMGMEQEAAEGDSVFLRGWSDYQRYCLKLTAASEPGLGHMALRARSEEALQRRVAAIERAGLGAGWIDGDLGHGPAYRFHDPDGHLCELYYETERYRPPPHLEPVLRNQPQRYTGRGAAVSRLDHVNLLAADVTPCRELAMDALGYRHHEGIVLDDGTEAGAWLSLTIAGHELIYVADARGARGRLHHVAFWVDTREEVLRAADVMIEHRVPIEFAPSKHTISQGFFLYVFEPGGNRIEITSGGYAVYDPEWEPVVWSQAERARGQAWEVATVESFHYYGTPPAVEDDRIYAARARAGMA